MSRSLMAPPSLFTENREGDAMQRNTLQPAKLQVA